VEDLLQESLEMWWQEADGLPPMERTFTQAEQRSRESCLDRFLRTVEVELGEAPSSGAERRCARRRLTDAFTSFAKTSLGLEDSHLELLLNHGFSDAATQLAREARHIDPSVSAADIFQASRNAWTACALQVLMGHRMRLTPAIFACSMLYPYTDNFLDDPAISTGAKLAFSHRFRGRLKGDRAAPRNEQEAIMWRFLELIEEQYPRADWPEVYGRLLMIHEAQENSVHMLRAGSAPANVDVLKFSFEKGGASVVADACLVGGRLTPEQARAAFGWGVLLQLADDLQDLQQDLREGILTIFTQSAARMCSGKASKKDHDGHFERGKESALRETTGKETESSGEARPRTDIFAFPQQPAAVALDALTTRTLNFGHRVMGQIDRMTSNGSARKADAAQIKPLKEMMRMSCLLLLIWSAGGCTKFYTRDYLARLETHSPFRFDPLAERRGRLARWNAPLTRMFDSLLEEESESTAPMLVASFLMPRAALS